ncbi:sugar transferase [Candidatus Sumerlaeota bacterium]|nr:sugar transferase [Candidatus Sumerlaeota bacterium]
MIRAFDIAFSLVALVLLAPLALLIALLIKIDSSGPVLFLQKRVGRGGVPFTMFKFRKMREGLANQGPAVTSRYDSRLTVVGRWLERTKLDELPQLLNVLKGDMAVVGPRPELEEFTRFYPEKWKDVLSVRPGLIGPSQVLHRNESELYPPDCRDREDFYVRRILPDKLDCDIRYIENASLLYNLTILMRALFRTLIGTITRDSTISTARSLYLLVSYTLVSILSLYAAYRLRYPDAMPVTDARIFRLSFPIPIVVYPLVFLSLRVHRRMFGSLTLEDVTAFFKSCVVGSFLMILVLLILDAREFSRLVYSIDFVFRFLGLTLLAYVEYQYTQKRKLLTGRDIVRAVVFEAVAVAFLVLCSILLIAFAVPRPSEAAADFARTIWAVAALAVAAPLIYMATFQEVPRRLVYYLKVKMKQTAIMLAQGALFLVVVSLLLDVRDYSRPAVLLSIVVLTASLMAFFVLTWWLRWRSLPEVRRDRVLLIGLAPDLDLFITALQRSHVDYSIVGIISDETRDRFYTVSKIEILGTLNELEDVLNVYRVDTFVVSSERLGPHEMAWVRQIARAHNVAVRYITGVDRFMRLDAEREESALERSAVEEIAKPSLPVTPPAEKAEAANGERKRKRSSRSRRAAASRPKEPPRAAETSESVG